MAKWLCNVTSVMAIRSVQCCPQALHLLHLPSCAPLQRKRRPSGSRTPSPICIQTISSSTSRHEVSMNLPRAQTPSARCTRSHWSTHIAVCFLHRRSGSFKFGLQHVTAVAKFLLPGCNLCREVYQCTGILADLSAEMLYPSVSTTRSIPPGLTE